jgi:hypothetical protein
VAVKGFIFRNTDKTTQRYTPGDTTLQTVRLNGRYWAGDARHLPKALSQTLYAQPQSPDLPSRSRIATHMTATNPLSTLHVLSW